MTANLGQPDPLTNRRLSDDCWNGRHWRRRKKGDGRKVIVCCSGWRGAGEVCECLCHDQQRQQDAEKGLAAG